MDFLPQIKQCSYITNMRIMWLKEVHFHCVQHTKRTRNTVAKKQDSLILMQLAHSVTAAHAMLVNRTERG
jgi:hypothetical protein